MSVDAKCPLSAADREKYCLCETCLFVKQCLEDIDTQMREMDSTENLPDGAGKGEKWLRGYAKMSISEISINQMVYYWRRPVSIWDAMLIL